MTDYKQLFVLKNVVRLLDKLDIINSELNWLAVVALVHTEQLWSNEAVSKLLREANESKKSERLPEADDRGT